MAISLRGRLLPLVSGIAFFIVVAPLASASLPMGAKPGKEQVAIGNAHADAAQDSNMTIGEMGRLFWPDSKATELQREEALKKILGKRVTWEITVAQIQRDGSGYLIQGQSNKDMIGTFCYVNPASDAEKKVILDAAMDSKLKISGIVQDIQMRHIILRPATIIINS